MEKKNQGITNVVQGIKNTINCTEKDALIKFL